jgi:hypothetical protein
MLEEESIFQKVYYTSKTNLEKRYEIPLIPYLIYNERITSRNLESLARNKQLTNKLQPVEVQDIIRTLLKWITREPNKYILGLTINWGFMFEYEGMPILVCENENKTDENINIYILEDFLYPPLESREKMLLTGAFFLCLVGVCKFLEAS